MSRKVALALFVPLVLLAVLVARMEISRRPRLANHAAPAISQLPPTSLNSSEVSDHDSLSQPSEAPDAASEADPSSAPGQSAAPWKSYSSSEYGFEIKYPADWEFDGSSNYENNYGKPPSGHGRPAYAGETRTLFGLEMDGPGQPQDGGGDFEDGAIVEVEITGTSGVVESWSIPRDRPPQQYVQTSSPADWLKFHTSIFSGSGIQNVAIDTNRFTGAIQIDCSGADPCKVSGEEGGAYRVLPGGRVLLVSWERAAYSAQGPGSNDFSYQKYFLPMLSSLRMPN